MSDKSAKSLRETEKKNAAANKGGQKSALHHSKGSPKSGIVKAKPVRKAKKG